MLDDESHHDFSKDYKSNKYIIITLGWPSPILSPNARSHYMVVAKAKKKSKREAYVETMSAMNKFNIKKNSMQSKLDVDINFYPPTSLNDIDNLLARMKASLDGIAAALGVDDRNFYPRMTLNPRQSQGKVMVALHPL